MPAGLSDYMREQMALYFKSRATKVGLHAGDPGTAGTANEATGGTYARLTPTWNDGTVDGKVVATEMTFNAGAAAYSYLSFWDASNNFLGASTIPTTTLSQTGDLLVTPTFHQTV